MDVNLGVMKDFLTRIFKRKFVRNVLTMASGTAFAQAITMLFSPILTRMYGPEVFGIVAIFASILGILAPWSTLTYIFAIVLPKTDEEAFVLFKLSLYLAVSTSLTVLLLFWGLGAQIVEAFNLQPVEPFLLLVPLLMFVDAVSQTLRHWMIRKEKFKSLTKINVASALVGNVSKALAGLQYPVATTLIVLNIAGNAFFSLLLFFGVRKDMPENIQAVRSLLKPDWQELREAFLKYKDFPFLRTPQVFLNAVSQVMPALMLASFFGPAAAGFYGIGRRVLGLPSTLIGASIASVFYPRIAKAAHQGEDLRKLVLQVSITLAAVGFVPFGLVFAFGPWMFGLVFGAEWVTSGEYARWLSLWLYFGFINTPSVQTIPILNIQGWFLKYEIVSIVLRIASIVFGFYVMQDDVSAIMAFSGVGVVLNIFLIAYVIVKCGTTVPTRA